MTVAICSGGLLHRQSRDVNGSTGVGLACLKRRVTVVPHLRHVLHTLWSVKSVFELFLATNASVLTVVVGVPLVTAKYHRSSIRHLRDVPLDRVVTGPNHPEVATVSGSGVMTRAMTRGFIWNGS